MTVNDPNCRNCFRFYYCFEPNTCEAEVVVHVAGCGGVAGSLLLIQQVRVRWPGVGRPRRVPPPRVQ